MEPSSAAPAAAPMASQGSPSMAFPLAGATELLIPITCALTVPIRLGIPTHREQLMGGEDASALTATNGMVRLVYVIWRHRFWSIAGA